MKVKIKDMADFLSKVDMCAGEVYLVYSGGGSENIRQNPLRQSELVDEWRNSGNCLMLTLEFTVDRDSLRFSDCSPK